MRAAVKECNGRYFGNYNLKKSIFQGEAIVFLVASLPFACDRTELLRSFLLATEQIRSFLFVPDMVALLFLYLNREPLPDTFAIVRQGNVCGRQADIFKRSNFHIHTVCSIFLLTKPQYMVYNITYPLYGREADAGGSK